MVQIIHLLFTVWCRLNSDRVVWFSSGEMVAHYRYWKDFLYGTGDAISGFFSFCNALVLLERLHDTTIGGRVMSIECLDDIFLLLFLNFTRINPNIFVTLKPLLLQW